MKDPYELLPRCGGVKTDRRKKKHGNPLHPRSWRLTCKLWWGSAAGKWYDVYTPCRQSNVACPYASSPCDVPACSGLPVTWPCTCTTQDTTTHTQLHGQKQKCVYTLAKYRLVSKGCNSCILSNSPPPTSIPMKHRSVWSACPPWAQPPYSPEHGLWQRNGCI